VNSDHIKEQVKTFITFLEVEKNASPHTVRAYSGDLDDFVSFIDRIAHQEDIAIISLPHIVQRYIVSLFYKKISKTTLARKFSCLRSFQTFLQAQGIDLKIHIKNPRIDRKLPVILSVDEIFFLLDDIKNEDLPTRYPFRDKCIFELIYATGVRCSELVSIILDDINFSEKTIRIMGKGRKERIVLFGSKAIDMMQKYLLLERPTLLKKGEQSHLFLNYFGDALSVRSVQRIFEMFRRFLKLERQLSPHKVRHSFATHLLNQGADLRMIQELLGHKTIATTEIYTHVTNQQLAKMCDEKHPLNNLNDLVFGEKL